MAKRKKFSKATRQRMAEAQRARWAKVNRKRIARLRKEVVVPGEGQRIVTKEGKIIRKPITAKVIVSAVRKEQIKEEEQAKEGRWLIYRQAAGEAIHFDEIPRLLEIMRQMVLDSVGLGKDDDSPID